MRIIYKLDLPPTQDARMTLHYITKVRESQPKPSYATVKMGAGVDPIHSGKLI